MIFAIIAYALVGTAIGRVLFVKRLGKHYRYAIQPKGWVDGQYQKEESLSQSDALASAQTYGLWSIPLWPLTLAIFLIQLPTGDEKRRNEQARLEKQFESDMKVIDA